MTSRGIGRIALAGAFGLIVLVAAAAAASAQVYVGVTPPQVGAIDHGATPAAAPQAPAGPAVQVLAESGRNELAVAPVTPRAPVSTLAFTGADIVGLCALAALSIVVGTAIVRVARRAPAH